MPGVPEASRGNCVHGDQTVQKGGHFGYVSLGLELVVDYDGADEQSGADVAELRDRALREALAQQGGGGTRYVVPPVGHREHLSQQLQQEDPP